MKKKYFLASLVLCFMILVNLLPTTVSAQETSGNKPGQAVDGTKPTMMAPSSTTNIKADRTQNGAPVIDANGTVTITEITADGGSKVTVVSKPTVNIAVENGSDFDSYTAALIEWLKANPDYASYMTPAELDALGKSDFKTVYLLNHLVAEKQLVEKQSNNK